MSSLLNNDEIRQSEIAQYNIDLPVAERVKIAEKRYNNAINEEKAILEEYFRLKNIFEEGLQLAQPVLSAHETLILQFVDQLVEKHAKIVGIMKKPRKQLVQRISRHVDNRLKISYYYRHLESYDKDDMKAEDRVTCIARSESWLEDCKELLSFDDLMNKRDDMNGSRDTIVLQVQIEKMLERQPQGIKDYVLVHKNRFAERLTKNTPKPVISLSQRKQRLNTGLHIPLEISTIIYSHCDLESCVSLRQVSTSWYEAYQHSEKSLKTKIRARMPWMQPEDEMNTWGLCALVFVGRLRSNKWSTVNCLNKLYAKRKETPVEQLVAVELKPYEKLSDEFMGLRSDESLWVGGKHLDLKTLETVNGFERFEYLDSNEKEYDILYKGITITLPEEAVIDTYPPHTHFKLPYPITVNRLYITVRCEGYSYIFPRSHPHYRYANKHFKNTGSFEMNNVAGIKVGFPGIECSKQEYRFLDPRTRRLREYMPRCRAVPKACYNGLFWWVEKNRNVIPTFIDLEKPGVMYYRKDKIITVDEGDLLDEKLRARRRGPYAKGEFEQSTEAGNTRFMTKQSDRGLLIIDLNSGKVTECVDPNDTGNGEPSVFIPGFLQGKYTQSFSAKYVSAKTREVYSKDAGLLDKFVEAQRCGKCETCEH